MFELQNKVILITGAGQGIGAGVAKILALKGALVAVNDLQHHRAEKIAKNINDAGGRALALGFDVTDYKAVCDALTICESQLGVIDILINNAGIPEGMNMHRFQNTCPKDWQSFIDVNLYGVMNCCHAVIPGMVERRWGRVITISSAAGLHGLSFGVSSYAAGKGGAISFMRHFALENAIHGVTANTIALGLMDNYGNSTIDNTTEKNATKKHTVENNAIEKTNTAITKTIPMGRFGNSDDVGALCVYLASKEASWMTGQTLELNGGSYAG